MMMTIGSVENWKQWMTEELAAYKDWDLYIPPEFKKNNILYCLSARFDAGKKLDILDKALQYDNKKKIPDICQN